MQQVIAMMRQDRYIDAIKEFRVLYGAGLKEAKDAVDAIRAVMSKPEAPKQYIVLDRNDSFGDFDLTYADDKHHALRLANNLVTNSHDVYIATVVAKSEPVTTRSMKEVA